jgi:hypothetical protein
MACTAKDPEAEKMAVFEKFMQATQAETQYQQMMSTIETQAQNRFVSRLRQQYRMFNVITQEKQAKIKAVMEEAQNIFAAKFKSQLYDNITYSDVKDKVYYWVFTKQFNTSELKAFVTFYESPAGKKLIAQTPSIMQNTMEIFNRQYGSRLNELIHSVTTEELQKIKPELEKIKDF